MSHNIMSNAQIGSKFTLHLLQVVIQKQFECLRYTRNNEESLGHLPG
jgi:hypothetical protein